MWRSGEVSVDVGTGLECRVEGGDASDRPIEGVVVPDYIRVRGLGSRKAGFLFDRWG